jgi:hypothetical protein
LKNDLYTHFSQQPHNKLMWLVIFYYLFCFGWKSVGGKNEIIVGLLWKISIGIISKKITCHVSKFAKSCAFGGREAFLTHFSIHSTISAGPPKFLSLSLSVRISRTTALEPKTHRIRVFYLSLCAIRSLARSVNAGTSLSRVLVLFIYTLLNFVVF